ncbi:MAG: DNA polymerase III subunit gamma/tau [Chloroflexi bacterium]|nr:DNA polymerase III subunit gamma/tau [Chloroflexota bacterium]
MFPDLQTSTQPSEPHRALYLKWRPRRFEDVVGQEHVTRTLRNAVKLGRPAHAYLFTGPRGTGKTTVARILYRAVNCEHAEDGDPCNTCALCQAALESRALDLVEIDAASNRGIDDIRDLRDKVAYRPGEGRYRVYIIDEAHELTAPAWEAFLKTLEEPPPHALFVLATTEAHKVPATIVSRCQRFDFRRIPYQATKEQLARVADAEGLEVDPAVFERLALVARGGLRDALSLLDQLSAFAVGPVDMDVARAALSLPSIEAVRGAIDGMTRHEPGSVMAVVSDAAEGGADLRLFADELIVHLRALMLLRTGADARLGDELPEDEVAWLRERGPAWSIGALMQLVQTLSDALARTRDAAQFQVQTEVALLTACDVETLTPSPSPVPAPRTTAAPSASSAPAGSTLSAPTPAPAMSHREAPHEPPLTTVSAPSSSAAVSRPEDQHEAPVATVSAPTPPTTVSRPEAQREPLVGVVGVSPAPRHDPAHPPQLDEPLDPAPALASPPLASRWPDVIDQVKSRNGLLGSILGSARPIGVEDSVLVVAFSTDFNRKTAEKSTNRQLIEVAFQRIYGSAYRLKATVGDGDASGAPSLLDDPVINFAQRTFGGEPRRVPTD